MLVVFLKRLAGRRGVPGNGTLYDAHRIQDNVVQQMPVICKRERDQMCSKLGLLTDERGNAPC